MLFHEEEKKTILKLTDANGDHYSPIIMSFPEGDSYICKINTAWESDNGLEEDDPNYDEFWEEWYDVIKVITPGSNLEYAASPDGTKSPILLITYKHFPSKITKLDGSVVYEATHEDQQ